MLVTCKEILKKIEDHGYEAYAVGGFVRNYYMGIDSKDVDICTNATPKELNKIFVNALIPEEQYGAVTLMYKKQRFEITTYRREIRYENNRRPIEVQYISNLRDDLMRRDFTINTLCMNSNGEIIDLLNGKRDIDKKLIRMIDNPDLRLKEDVLRILRAIRFATILDFRLADDVKIAIKKNGSLLSSLSYTRKKDELTRIFSSPNASYGIDLICSLGIDRYLSLFHLNKVKIVDDILGIWAQLNVIDIYPFSKAEKEIINKVIFIINLGKIDNMILYKYGLYNVSIAASILNIPKKDIAKMYDELPIKSRNEININSQSLSTVLNRKPGEWIKEILSDIEQKIIKKELVNEEQSLMTYIINKYAII
jgi:tRNA nucleotidyltransferase (CCA-adding enzyme)